jgi:Ser/Thr protein kinase RdoA (MazF antagonist)
MLEQSDIAHYLLSLGVVKPREVIDEGFAVVDASRRNCVYLATTRSGPTFVVKQATPRNASALSHEATVLRVLAEAPGVAPHVPAVVHEDDGLVVLRTPPGGRDWADHRGRFPSIPARLLGRILAALHRLPADIPPGAGPMWGLLLPEPPHELVLDLSTGAQDLVARIQASDSVCSRLEELRASSSSAALVHGDLRWENCLALPAPGGRRRTRVLLVDWELADRADPAFDVGSVLAEYLRVWVGSVPIVERAEPARLRTFARHPLQAVEPAMQAFWSSYRSASRRPPALGRVMELTAVRLLEIAIERAQGLTARSSNVDGLLDVAASILRRPALAGIRLGLHP